MFPLGLVIPGDKGVPKGLTASYYKAFAPRIGVAWDPRKDGKMTVRGGFGIFYNPVEQLVLEQFQGEPALRWQFADFRAPSPRLHL